MGKPIYLTSNKGKYQEALRCFDRRYLSGKCILPTLRKKSKKYVII